MAQQGDKIFTASETNAGETVCGIDQAISSDKKCRSKLWDLNTNPTALADLYAACTIPGREVGRLFVSSLPIKESHGCNSGVAKLLEGTAARGIEVYMLYAASDEAFSEKNKVGRVAAYNERCGSTTGFKFTGVSINNEFFTRVKCKDPTKEETFIKNLKAAKDAVPGLKLHFSLGWHWSKCSSPDRPNDITINGVTKKANEHMIDIADSVDVQVA